MDDKKQNVKKQEMQELTNDELDNVTGGIILADVGGLENLNIPSKTTQAKSLASAKCIF